MYQEPQSQTQYSRSVSRELQTFGGASDKVTYKGAVINLIGHLFGTAIVFIAFISFGWGISFFVYWLNSFHQLQPNILDFINLLELGIAYADAILCFFLVLAGARKFLRELGRMR